MGEASLNFFQTIVGRFFFEITDPNLYMARPAILYDRGPRPPNVGWYVGGHFLPIITNLLTAYVSKGWEGHFDEDLVASCINGELERRKSFGNNIEEAGKGIGPESFSVFSGKDAVWKRIEDEIDKAMIFAHGIPDPSIDDFLNRENLVFEYGHSDRKTILRTSYYMMRIKSAAEHLTLSCNDLHLLAEFEFKRKWGTRSGVFSLTPEHEMIMSTIEAHELSQLHQCYMANPSAAKESAPEAMTDYLGDMEIDWPKFSDAEIKFFRNFDEILDVVTEDPDNYPSYRYVHAINLTFDDIQKTLHRPGEFIKMIAERTQDVLNMRAITPAIKVQVDKRWEGVELYLGRLVDTANIIDQIGTILRENTLEVFSVNENPTVQPLMITSRNDGLMVMPLEALPEKERVPVAFEAGPA